MTQLPSTHAPQSHTSPNPPRPPRNSPRRTGFLGSLTPRTIAAPLAAFTMAILLYTYSVTSIRAAKRNAALHRAADGGQLDMRRESLRRHGALDKVEGTKGLELFRDSTRTVAGPVDDQSENGDGDGDVKRGENGNGNDAVTGVRSGGGDGYKKAGRGGAPRHLPVEREEVGGGRARTEVEGGLESWKGREGQERWKSSPPPRVDGKAR